MEQEHNAGMQTQAHESFNSIPPILFPITQPSSHVVLLFNNDPNIVETQNEPKNIVIFYFYDELPLNVGQGLRIDGEVFGVEFSGGFPAEEKGAAEHVDAESDH